MTKAKKILVFGALTIITLGVVMFIVFSNDHVECEHTTKTYTDADGNKVTENKHICKEKFSF